MQVYDITKPGDPAFLTMNANILGTAQFSNLIPTKVTVGGKTMRARMIRIKGRLVSPAGGGTLTIRAAKIDDNVIPGPGAAGDYIGARNALTTAATDTITVASTTARSFSACFFNVDPNAAIDAETISLRVSNPGTAYSAGQVIIDEVELGF